ncbi:hypothetical protein Z169_11587, partial [Egretta garzetta]
DLAGPAAATVVPIVPVGVRAARARTIGSTIAVQTPPAQGAIAPIAVPTPRAPKPPVAVRPPPARG